MTDEINFDDAESVDSNILTAEDFSGTNYLKNPPVGESLVLEITKVERNEKTTATNKTTGKDFPVGLKQKDGVVKRYDIHTPSGIYTISNWEIYFKLFGNTGILLQYAKSHSGTFTGAKVSIKRLVDATYVNYKVEDLAKIQNKTVQEASAYLAEVKQAIKEQRLFEVKEVV